MKLNKQFFFTLAVCALVSVASQKVAAQSSDDLYYDPSTDAPAYVEAPDDNTDNTRPEKVGNSNGSRYNDYDDDYDNYYSSRIRRFHRPISNNFGFYDPCYVNNYFNPFGPNVVVVSPWGNNWGNNWGWGNRFNNSWGNSWGNNFGFNYGGFDPYWGAYGFNNYYIVNNYGGYGGWNPYGGGFGGGFCGGGYGWHNFNNGNSFGNGDNHQANNNAYYGPRKNGIVKVPTSNVRSTGFVRNNDVRENTKAPANESISRRAPAGMDTRNQNSDNDVRRAERPTRNLDRQRNENNQSDSRENIRDNIREQRSRQSEQRREPQQERQAQPNREQRQEARPSRSEPRESRPAPSSSPSPRSSGNGGGGGRRGGRN